MDPRVETTTEIDDGFLYIILIEMNGALSVFIAMTSISMRKTIVRQVAA